jgi:gliding motility-associated-like protein
MGKFKVILLVLGTFVVATDSYGQLQACPANINYATGDLSYWAAQTGLVGHNTQTYPAPNAGVAIIPEYTIGTTGIEVISSPGVDLYGSFPTIPTINGYAYNYSVKIGSTATSYDLRASSGGGGSTPGGFTRAISYVINVPAGSPSVPYTMTYAYAMVLENGTHNSSVQPLFKATLQTKDSIISCASPQYYLPTFGNTSGNGTGATLDSATAIANGFSNSPVAFLSHSGNNGTGSGTLLYDVWTKGWTEVTFDLSPYRGQQVTLTFEADNCTPGAHFAYAYVALRNLCAGLKISGDSVTCANSPATYSVPSLGDAIYDWQVPQGWTILSGASSNIIQVTPGANKGYIVAHELNGCANLRDSLFVSTRPPTVAGAVMSSTTVCSGSNSTLLHLNGQTGSILKWLYSTDGTNWNSINNTTPSYAGINLTTTTQYKALVQNGGGCSIDSSAPATIVVDSRSKGGAISPNYSYICTNQPLGGLLTLAGSNGSIVNWQSSTDSSQWKSFVPPNSSNTYTVNTLNTTTWYRGIVKNGVCPADTSAVAAMHFTTTPYPQATIDPALSSICYGASTTLHATITIGSSYTWAPPLGNVSNGSITSVPYTINAPAAPLQNTSYVLGVTNAGCPNILRDTFQVLVAPKIVVNAGKDTAILAGQPVYLSATTNDPTVNQYLWTPSAGLSATDIFNPVALLSAGEGNSITYLVKATNATGCVGQDDITIRIFTTGADIFVPTAFTPNGDGRNDKGRPVCVGIKQLNYFRIYNRWGEMVFQTTNMEEGWDGVYNGRSQGTGTFVYLAEGIDLTGKRIFRKGTITLIR